MSLKIPKVIVGVFFVFIWLLLVDRLVFGYGMWLLPNEFAWNTHYFYNFVYEYKKIQRTPKTKPRIFLIGSSIAYYSIARELLIQEIYKKTGEEVDISYFCYAGNSPLYIYLFLDQLLELKPDLIVYPLNFVDFRLHRQAVKNPSSPFIESAEERVLIQDAVSEEEAPQARNLLPYQTLKELWSYLDWDKRGELLSASLFYFYRYKEFFLDSIHELIQHRWTRNTSYHAYNGVQIPERVNSLGWTSKKFSFQAIPKIQKEGFWIEVVDEFFKKGPLQVQIYSNSSPSSKSHVQRITFHESGWKKILLDPEFFYTEPEPFLTVELSHVWYSYEASGFLRDYHWDPMGVRLTQTFGLEKPRKDVYFQREERLEDLRYLNMDEKTYREYFFYRLLSDLPNRPGIRYLYEIAETKKRIAKESFRPILHFRYLEKITKKLGQKKVPLLIINNPENPVSLEWYVDSKWYDGYLEYLHSLTGEGVFFVDGKDIARMQDFSDFHHLTYPGMVQQNNWYANQILKIYAFLNIGFP